MTSSNSPLPAPGIVVTDNAAAHRYQAVVDGHTAVATYGLEDGSIRFIHTLVPEALRGRGIATALVVHALADVRARGLLVTPQCPVFAAYMRGHAETHDLLSAEGRAMLGLAAAD